MTVSTEIILHSYFPGSDMAEEPIPFQFLDADHVSVSIVGASGLLVAGTDYVITGNGRTLAANIRALRVFAEDEEVRLLRDTALRQDAVTDPFKPLPAEQVGRELDRRALIEQELAQKVDRAPKTPIGGGAEGQFPVVLPGNIWGFASGTGNDPAFRADVANPASDKGAALVAFSAAAPYGAGSTGDALKLRGISVSDFPFLASPDQTADFNTAAFNAACAALPAEGGLITIPAGIFYLNDEVDTLGKNISFTGAGKTATHLSMLHATRDLLIITGGGSITIEGMTFSSPDWLPRTDGAFIVFDAGDGVINYSSTISRCTFHGAYIGIDARRNSDLAVNDCAFVALDSAHAGIIVNNLTNGDSGDSKISDCYFGQNEAPTDAVAILQNSSGGLRINNTKVNGWTRGYALEMEEIASFGNTSILIITGSSFENCTECAIDLERIAGDGIFTYIIIDGNEIAYCPVSIRVTDDADVFYDGMISNNVIAIANGGTGIHLDGGNNWTITDNIFDGVTGLATAIHVGATARNTTLGEKNFRNISTPLVDDAPDTYRRLHSFTLSISVTTNVAQNALYYGESTINWPAGIFAYPPKIFPTVQGDGVSASPGYTATPSLTSRVVRGWATSNGVPMVCDVLVVGW